jgi:hypothetical protein
MISQKRRKKEKIKRMREKSIRKSTRFLEVLFMSVSVRI